MKRRQHIAIALAALAGTMAFAAGDPGWRDVLDTPAVQSARAQRTQYIALVVIHREHHDGAVRQLGEVTRDLGNVYRELGCRPHNSSGLFYFVAGRPGQPISLPGTEASHFDATLQRLLELEERLARLERDASCAH